MVAALANSATPVDEALASSSIHLFRGQVGGCPGGGGVVQFKATAAALVAAPGILLLAEAGSGALANHSGGDG